MLTCWEISNTYVFQIWLENASFFFPVFIVVKCQRRQWEAAQEASCLLTVNMEQTNSISPHTHTQFTSSTGLKGRNLKGIVLDLCFTILPYPHTAFSTRKPTLYKLNIVLLAQPDSTGKISHFTTQDTGVAGWPCLDLLVFLCYCVVLVF